MRHLGPTTEVVDLVSRGDVVSGYSGGTDGRVVRWSTGTTYVDADQTDTPAQLLTCLFKQGGRLYRSGSVITGLSGLSAGSVYFLGSTGQLTATAPTPSATVAQMRVGVALAADVLMFRPGEPIRGS